MVSNEEHMTSLIDGACSGSQLERSRALSSLALRLKAGGCHRHEDGHGDEVRRLWDAVRGLTGSEAWASRLGGIEVAKLLVQHAGAGHGTGCGLAGMADLDVFVGLLEDPEVRVRKAVGELLGEVSRVSLLLRSPDAPPVYVWEEVGGRILESIERNYNREDCSSSADGCDPTDDPEATEVLDPISSLPGLFVARPSSPRDCLPSNDHLPRGLRGAWPTGNGRTRVVAAGDDVDHCCLIATRLRGSAPVDPQWRGRERKVRTC